MKTILLISLALIIYGCNSQPCSGEDCFSSTSWLGYASKLEIQTQYDIAKVNNKDFTVNISDKLGNAPLMYAARNNRHAESIQLFIALGAKVNTQNNDGWTALMYAADNNRIIEVIQVLLENGAKVNLANNSGENALTRAYKTAGSKQSTKNGNTDIGLQIIELLKMYQ